MTTYPLRSLPDYWELCCECAHAIYRGAGPVPAERGARVARQLFGTGAAESAFSDRDRRQNGFDYSVLRGAWGLWQIERISVAESVRQLHLRPDVADRAGRFIWRAQPPFGNAWFQRIPVENLLKGMALGLNGADPDRVGVAFCRMHYLWKAEAIPSSVEAQAAYYKRHYNTAAGKGNGGRYVSEWNRLCRPIVERGCEASV